jgi:hypothetical protein
MSDAQLPMAYRDSCAGLLIGLNRCRVDSYYLPWKCNVRRKQPFPRARHLSALDRTSLPPERTA